MALALIRAVKGPTIYDRILASNMFGTKTVLMIAVLGFLMGRGRNSWISRWAYALINFVGTIAVLKVFKYGDLGRSGDDDGNHNGGAKG